MSTTKKNTGIFLFLLCGALLFNACSPAFKKKMEIANKLKKEIVAKNVTVGFETKTDTDKGKRSMTTLVFTGINPDGWDELGMQIAANLLAYKFMKEMNPQEMANETHVSVTLEMADGTSFNDEFLISDLKEAEPLIAVADEAVNACVKQDNKKLHELNDQAYLPDSVMGDIYHVNHYNDSVFAGKTRKPEIKGMRFANAEDYSDLKLLSLLYIEQHPGVRTRYDVNVDRKTKKIVYISVYTDQN